MRKVWAVNIVDIFEPAQKFPTLGHLFNVLLPNLFLLAGIIFFILIVAAGFKIIQGAGSGDAATTEQGKKAITYTVLGFILIFVAYWLMQLVKFLTGVDIFNPPLEP